VLGKTGDCLVPVKLYYGFHTECKLHLIMDYFGGRSVWHI
jgi:hypothetical protein